MSEEKLYAVKNYEGKYLDTYLPTWWDDEVGSVFKRIDLALMWAKKYGGHVVTLIEEPEKPVLPKEVADEISFAKSITGVTFDEYIVRELIRSDYKDSATNKMIQSPDVPNAIEVLLNAWNNGYTVAKEKKYVVYKNLGGKHNTNAQYAQAYKSANRSSTFSWTITSWILNDEDTNGNGSSFQFTEAEIEHYGLQDCEKEEVTDDEQ